jgi:hypothetical protein
MTPNGSESTAAITTSRAGRSANAARNACWMKDNGIRHAGVAWVAAVCQVGGVYLWEVKLLDHIQNEVFQVFLWKPVQQRGWEQQHLFSITGFEDLFHSGVTIAKNDSQCHFSERLLGDVWPRWTPFVA